MASEFSMNSTAKSLINVFYRVAKLGPEALQQLGGEIKENGRDLRPEQVSAAVREAHQVREHLKNDTSDDATLRTLGGIFESPDSALAVTKMVFPDPPVPEGESAVSHLLYRLQAFQNGDLETAYGRPPSAGSPSASDPSSGMKANRRPFDPDDSAEAGLTMPSAESMAVKLFTLFAMLTMVAYIALRLYDIIVNIHYKEKDGSRTFYRVFIILCEMAYGLSSCSSIVSRTSRQRLEAMSRSRKDTPFAVDDVITLLYVSDETTATIEESVRSHYAAAKPELPFRVVLVADAPGGPAAEAVKNLSRQYGSLLHFVKEDLAKQEYVMNVANEELQAALNVVLEENMYLGQVLFYCLDRLFLQYGHTISNAAIVVMPASSVVDSENYYNWSLSYLQQPGFACVSTPTRARNQNSVTDFLDISNYTREQVYLSTVGGDNKFAINNQAFMARGYSLWRVLRRMEMENVDSHYLGWITYVMHIEARQATLAAASAYSPITSVLAPTHGPSVLSQVLDRQAEGYDLALIFDRERPFLSWNLQNPLRAQHDAARMAVFFEVVIIIVMLVTLVNNIAPWSTSYVWVAVAFLAHYGGMMLFHLCTPYLALAPGMIASVMRNRVLAAAWCWLYFLNLSRFGVDRRGHFRAVGETTTADLVTYKQKQQEAKEELKIKTEMKAKEAKEKAEKEASAKKTKQQEEAVLKKRELQRKKEEDQAAKEEAKAAAKAAKEKEKLRRARRGPGMAMVESHALRAFSADIDFDVEAASITSTSTTPPTAAVAEPPFRSPSKSPAKLRAGPVAEGFFSRNKGGSSSTGGGAVGLDEAASSSMASVSVVNGGRGGTTQTSGGLGKRDKKSLLPQHAAPKLEIPKFSVPGATSNTRTGSGDRHRPHKFIKGASVPIAVLFMLLGALSILLTFLKTFGSDAPKNYTAIEIIAARSWTISCALLGLYIIIAAFVYLSFVARFSALTANFCCAGTFLTVSGLLVLLIGAFPFLSVSILETRNSEFDLEGLHKANMQFFASMAAGPAYSPLRPGWRADSDMNVQNVRNGQSLAGGWYTGPGLSKFTYPQALMLIDLSFVAIAHYKDLSEMPSAAPPAIAFNRTAADDVKEVLLHGARYLVNCHDPASDSVVAFVSNELSTAAGSEWIEPEQRQDAQVQWVDRTNPGTETFATVSGAFAALSIALDIFDEQDIVDELRARANSTFNLMESTPRRSYADNPDFAALNVGQFWPSNGDELYDDMLLAAGLMLYSAGSENRFRNAVNAYYTMAQQERASRQREGDTGLGGLEDFRMAVDDHWWTANILLFQADSLNSRYKQNLLRFIDAWQGEYDFHQGIDGSLIQERDGLMVSTPPQWLDNRDPGFTTPGVLPMTVRAMSYIMVHAASQMDESDADRSASCFAKGQLRNLMGLNSDARSYFAGISLDNAAFPRQPIIRPKAGPPNFGDGGENPVIVQGALVNGPSATGAYQDSRQVPENNGIGILNNSPISLLLASLRSRDLDIEDCIGFKPRDRRHKTATTVTRSAAGRSTLQE